jgi:hypothetical protein
LLAVRCIAWLGLLVGDPLSTFFGERIAPIGTFDSPVHAVEANLLNEPEGLKLLTVMTSHRGYAPDRGRELVKRNATVLACEMDDDALLVCGQLSERRRRLCTLAGNMLAELGNLLPKLAILCLELRIALLEARDVVAERGDTLAKDRGRPMFCDQLFKTV